MSRIRSIPLIVRPLDFFGDRDGGCEGGDHARGDLDWDCVEDRWSLGGGYGDPA